MNSGNCSNICTYIPVHTVLLVNSLDELLFLLIGHDHSAGGLTDGGDLEVELFEWEVGRRVGLSLYKGHTHDTQEKGMYINKYMKVYMKKYMTYLIERVLLDAVTGEDLTQIFGLTLFKM